MKITQSKLDNIHQIFNFFTNLDCFPEGKCCILSITTPKSKPAVEFVDIAYISISNHRKRKMKIESWECIEDYLKEPKEDDNIY